MRRVAGQAALWTGRLLRLALGLAAVAGLGLGALAWRLEQGPMALPWLAREVERSFNAGGGPTRLEIGEVAISWAGWREGHRSPIEFALRHVRAVEADGAVRAGLPDAVLSLSLSWLMRGVVAPRALELRGLELRAIRGADGAFSLDLGSLGAGEAAADPAPDGRVLETLAALMRPPSDDTPLAAMRRLRLLEARLTVADAQLGRSWSADIAALSLTRREGGGLDLGGAGAIRLGQERVPLRISGMLDGRTMRGDARLSLPVIRPAALARAAPLLQPLGALDAPAGIEVEVPLEGLRVPSAGRARLTVGAGGIDLGARGRLSLAGLEAEASYAGGLLRLERAVLRPAPPREAAGPAPTIRAEGQARQDAAGWHADLGIRLDRLAFADLAHYWPAGIVPGARSWLVENVTAGHALDGAWRIAVSAPAAGAPVALTAFEGSASAEGVEVHWLRPIPPATGARGTARFGLAAIELDVAGAAQSGGAMALRGGRIRFGFETDPETAELELLVEGPLADAWALLRHPRLRLFDRRPPPVPALFGTLRETRLLVGFPLIGDLPVERITVSASGRANDVRVPRALLGRDLERGAFDFAADTEGLRVSGTGTLAGIALRIQQEADFRSGPAAQVVARETVSGRAEARQIAGLGLDPRPFVEGMVGIDVRSETRRNGQTRAQMRTDFTGARLAVDALAWAKRPGVAAAGEGVLILQNGTLQRIEGIRITAPDALMRGAALDARDNVPRRIVIQEGRLGRSRITGEIFPPQAAAAGWQLALRGPLLDLAPALAAPSAPPAEGPAPRGPGVAIEARFDRMLLLADRSLTAVNASARVDAAGVVQAAEVSGRVAEGGAFQMSIVPEGARRRLRITSADGGGLLRAFGVLRTVQGGRLSVDAAYAHSRPGAPLTGSAELEEFSVTDAPALAKLLQAMTVYGVFEALSAQGLTFASLTAPFTLTREALVLNDARAFSVSLGLTARGRIDRLRDAIDMEGTIVPAYVFNSLLGRIPILGRVFSPERGGGVFAATYRMRGPLADPSITVNPLAALTPGFLRGVFGLGQDGAPTDIPAPAR